MLKRIDVSLGWTDIKDTKVPLIELDDSVHVL